jgi:cytochrome P450
METEPILFNPFEPGFYEDPYAQYRLLRERDPVHQSPMGVRMLFRYADVSSILADHRQSADFRKATPTEGMQAMLDSLGERINRERQSMLGTDPPDHTRLRKLVSKAFTPRAIDNLRGRIQQLVDEALDAVEPSGRMDVITDLAFPLPFTVISEMLGMPMGERDQLRAWSSAMVKTLDPILMPEEVEAAFQAGEKMEAYVLDVIAHKRRNPAGDMLSALIAAEEQGDMLSDAELIDQVQLLYIAGHETTVNLIGNGTLALLRHRTQLERLRTDPALTPNAIEELLRYDSPVQFSRRIILEPIEVDGATLEPGSIAMLGLGSSNRDPAFWGPDADELDISRERAAEHVSFGGGRHFCLGAALARLEGQIAIGTLVRRFEGVELDEENPPWNGRVNLRGLSSLPVRLS